MAQLVYTFAESVLQAAAGRAIDALFAPDTAGPRLEPLQVLSSTEGAGLPIVYGRARVAGQLVWAARFEETAVQTSGGAATRTDYVYSASFAIALCEGVIDGIGRVWADGRLLDLSAAALRVYPGTETQAPDPLIEAVEGAGDPPAFRGTAYVVFEDLPLAPFGDRIPQLTFEVFRTPPAAEPEGPRLEDLVQGVTLIPGSGEFVYGVTPVAADLGLGREESENARNSRGLPHIEEALDDLEARLPQCGFVMLVVAWHGGDLRCGNCEIRPRVEQADKLTRPYAWSVDGVERAAALVVSDTDGRPDLGGAPADRSVLEAIAAIKARGMAVGLHPFVLMDIPPGNGLPDPYGAAEQAAFPWRGRITCHPAPGRPGSPDKTMAAGDQVRAFFGSAAAADFVVSGQSVSYAGAPDWGLRRFVLHYAHLAAAAGGVDAFLVGSELRGVTSVRESASAYPATDELIALAAEARSVLGSATKISYGADWTEYSGHQPQDGSGDVFFHLDPLWADADIDFVGIDWYAPLADWRDGASHLDADAAATIYDRAYLTSSVEGGEGYDWHYPDQAARDAQERAPITDGAAGKPWVFRPKDIRSWWGEPHYDRPGGVEGAAPTAWVPEGKPVRFVELGCPAVDKGANQPNVFVDPKSAESALPHYSSGARDDLIQRRAIETLLDYWRADGGRNSVSSVYDGPMIDAGSSCVWTWDARPYPDFPARTDVWADGANWRLGHWLTGRAGIALLADAAADIAARTGESVDASALDGLVPGYVVDRPMSARAALEPLARLYDFTVAERGGALALLPRGGAPAASLDLDVAVLDDEARRCVRALDDVSARPAEARLRFYDEARDFRPAAVSARDAGGAASPVIEVTAPVVLDPAGALAVVRSWIADAVTGGESLRLRLPPSQLALEAGDVVAVEGRAFRIERITDGLWREAELRAASTARRAAVAGGEAGVGSLPVEPPARPFGVVLDLPLLPGESARVSEGRGGPRAAVAAQPWPGEVAIGAGADASSVAERARARRPSGLGELVWDLHPGPVGRWDEGNVVRVRIVGAALSSAAKPAVLGGANTLAVEGAGGEWEILQFREAALVAPEVWEIRGLLRALQGTEPGQAAVKPAGARVVVLAGAAVAVPLEPHERGAVLAWRFAPAGRPLTDAAAGEATAAWEGRDLRPLAPVHLAVRRAGADLLFTWKRRTRIGGDDWAAVDVPLGEAEERYRFELLAAGETVLAREVAAPEALVTAAEEEAALGAGPHSAFEARVAQVSASWGAGAAREAVVFL